MHYELELMEMQVRALFTHDHDNFMQNINELNGAAAPRFFYGCTSKGYVLRFRHDLPPDIMAELKNLVSGQPVCLHLPRSTALLEGIKKVLQGHKEIQHIYEGPAFKLQRGLAVPSDVFRITQDNVNILENSFEYMVSELQYWEPCFVKLVNGNPVSICFSSRISDKAHEVGVETLPDFRGKGYAAEVVAAWAAAIYEMNRIPLYSTSWNNIASQSVARKLKAIQYGVDLSVY